MWENPNYSGGTGEDDFESNLFNDAPSENWYSDTYGADDFNIGAFNPVESQFDFNASIPEGTWQMPQDQQFGLGGDGIGIQLPEVQDGAFGGFDVGGIQQTLGNLFNSAIGNKGLMTGLGALMEGYQNKRKASSLNNLATQQQQRLDPFGSQRQQYQQLLSQAIQDPYSSPIVRDQVAQIQKAQAIKDAAAGRRSNQATSNPAMLAAQAQVAQDYIKSLYTPAGANIGPQDGGTLAARIQASNAGTHGYISPLLSALGMNTQTNTNNQSQQEILAKLQQLLAGAK